MYITAAIIGLGIYILFTDLPKGGQQLAYQYKWAAHACVFFGLFAMHGGSAEGTVLAAIGTVVFRWLMHMAEKRHAKQPTAVEKLVTPEEYLKKLDDGLVDTQTIVLAAILLAIMLYNH